MPMGKIYIAARAKPRRRTNRRRKTTTKARETKTTPPSINSIMLYRGPAPSKQRIVNLKYTDFHAVAGATPQKTYWYRANSLFDPNGTGVGHQPIGFDEWMTFYDHYTVLSSTIRVTFYPYNTNPALPVVFGIRLDDDNSPPASLSELMENGDVRYKIGSDYGASASAAIKDYTITHRFNCKKFFRIKDIEDNMARLGGIAGATPAEEAFFDLSYQSADSTTNVGTVGMLVEIMYKAMFSEPTDLSGS